MKVHYLHYIALDIFTETHTNSSSFPLSKNLSIFAANFMESTSVSKNPSTASEIKQGSCFRTCATDAGTLTLALCMFPPGLFRVILDPVLDGELNRVDARDSEPNVARELREVEERGFRGEAVLGDNVEVTGADEEAGGGRCRGLSKRGEVEGGFDEEELAVRVRRGG
ncbi:deaminase [Sesbania bispinosa]|nr:deaminase [Sesbania bispinosa]